MIADLQDFVDAECEILRKRLRQRFTDAATALILAPTVGREELAESQAPSERGVCDEVEVPYERKPACFDAILTGRAQLPSAKIDEMLLSETSQPTGSRQITDVSYSEMSQPTGTRQTTDVSTPMSLADASMENSQILQNTRIASRKEVMALARGNSRCTDESGPSSKGIFDHCSFETRAAWQTFDARSVIRMAGRLKTARQSSTVTKDAASSSALRSLTRTFKSLLYINPASSRRLCWDVMGLMLIMYDLLTIPMKVFDPPRTVATDVIQWISQVFWNWDMIGNFFVGFYKKGELVMKPALIARHYLTGWFPFDAIVVSVDWFFFAWGREEDSSAGLSRILKSIRFLRFLRTLKLLRLVKVRQMLDTVQQHIYSEVANVQYNIAKTFTRIVVINHLLACGWYGIGTLDQDVPYSWVRKYISSDRSFGYRYTSSLHWSLAQLGVGSIGISPENTAERGYAIFVLLAALLMFSSLMSTLVNLLAHLQDMQDEVNTQFWLLRRFCVENHVSKELSMRVEHFLQHAYRRRQRHVSDSELTIFQHLSEPLHAELQYQRYKKCLGVHPFFEKVLRRSFYSQSSQSGDHRWVIHKVAKDAMAVSSFATEDPIFCGGSVAKCMYFLEDGSCEYQRADLLPLSVWSGQWISEAALWTAWLHVGTLTAEIASQIVNFDAECLPQIMSSHPETWAMAHKFAEAFVRGLNETTPDELSDVDTLKSVVWQDSARDNESRSADMAARNSIARVCRCCSRPAQRR